LLKVKLLEKGIESKSHSGSLLWEPWGITNENGTPYKVFSPFFKKGCLNAPPPRRPLPRPENPSFAADPECMSIEDLGLLPSIPWDESMRPLWNVGEDGANQRLQEFLNEGLEDYKEGRNFPAEKKVSRLSPHLHFGELSPNQVWYAVQGQEGDAEHFLSELGWREFSYHLLYHFPDLPTENLQEKFDNFPWENNPQFLKAWQQGKTGYPIVDAGMRELWETGYMNNRVRMIVASFLVKNLRVHWHHGAAWFWDCLLDADLANNSASWQWVAGCGADAAPYFRIFNPVTQGEKFDPEGDYIRRFLPEIARLPNKYLFNPSEAPPSVLSDAGVKLGSTYPRAIVDLKASRESALEAFATLKTKPHLELQAI
jgi:deoxyribodipyrimidine photo-lyase